MASTLPLLRAKAAEASKYVVKNGHAYHKQLLLEKNKQYFLDPATVGKGQTFSKQLFSTRLASIPGQYRSFSTNIDQVKNTQKNTQGLNIEAALKYSPFSHISQGVRDIMVDYVHQDMTRTFVLVTFRLYLIITIKDAFLFLGA